jgi:hypothetical protein
MSFIVLISYCDILIFTITSYHLFYFLSFWYFILLFLFYYLSLLFLIYFYHFFLFFAFFLSFFILVLLDHITDIIQSCNICFILSFFLFLSYILVQKKLNLESKQFFSFKKHFHKNYLVFFLRNKRSES